jgi:DNA-binding protein HU-beta
VTKQEFVDAVARKAGLTPEEATRAVDAVLDAITETLGRGDSVTVTGFGKFSTADADFIGVNPRTGEKVAIDVKRFPGASASGVGDDAVWLSLTDAARELLRDADDLERSHETFADRIETSRRKLREIAEAT